MIRRLFLNCYTQPPGPRRRSRLHTGSTVITTDDDPPLSSSEFKELMKPFNIGHNEKLAVAVSGGPDSLALLYLLNQYAPGNIHALVVDHQLRPESTTESQSVEKQITTILKIPITRLVLDPDKTQFKTLPTAQIEEHARLFRYKSLVSACRAKQINHLFLGHHLNDQIETVMNRLARSSGLVGLGGMRPLDSNSPHSSNSSDTPIKLVRPLLSIPKSRLVSLCLAQKLEFVTDPTNTCMLHQRNVIRRVLNGHAGSGKSPYLSENALKMFVGHFSQYSHDASELANQLLSKSVLTDTQTGTAFLNLPNLALKRDHWFHEKPLATHILSMIMRWVECSMYPHTLNSVISARDRILSYYINNQVNNPPRNIVIGKSLILPPRPSRNGPGNWIIIRAPPIASLRQHARLRLAYNQAVEFDQRFFVDIQPSTVSRTDIRIQFDAFSRSLTDHLPIKEMNRLVIAGVSPSLHPTPTHELIVRYLDREDEPALLNIFRRRHVHPAWSQYRRAWEYYKLKMPLVSRFVVPVIAFRQIQSLDLNQRSAAPSNQSLLNGSNLDVVSKTDRPSKALVNSPLGAVVAIPCLGIFFLPDVFSVNVAYRSSLFKE